MTFVVTDNCIKCKYTDCVEVCPVDCFYEGPNFLVIHPDECIDCALCEPECPAQAIFSEDEVPENMQEFIELNSELAEIWPNITEKKDALPDAEEWDGVAGKLLLHRGRLRVWGMSLIRYAEGEGEQISMKVVSFGTTLLVAWLIWILTDTAIQHSLGLGGKSRPNTRALTMLPLIRNVLFATIAVIALIVALANMGMNVTPLLAGAGVIGLAIGFGAQSLVADLITGLFIIIEDSLSIDDYVDVGGHLGTVEGLTIRTVRLRDLDGVVHTIPFSEIKSIKNYSRQFGYAMFRWPVPASMPIDDAVALVREVAMELRSDPAVYRNLWSPMELQGVESFDNGQAILRFRFKTAPIKQWEVQRAFNLRLRRRLDQAGLELSMPRLNVQLSRAPKAKSAEPDEPGTPADGGI